MKLFSRIFLRLLHFPDFIPQFIGFFRPFGITVRGLGEIEIMLLDLCAEHQAGDKFFDRPETEFSGKESSENTARDMQSVSDRNFDFRSDGSAVKKLFGEDDVLFEKILEFKEIVVTLM